MSEPISKKRIFTVEKRWGRHVLRVNVWDGLLNRWEGWRDAEDRDLPAFFSRIQNPPY